MDSFNLEKYQVIKMLTQSYWQHVRHIEEQYDNIKDAKKKIENLKDKQEIISQQMAGLKLEFIPTLDDLDKKNFSWMAGMKGISEKKND